MRVFNVPSSARFLHTVIEALIDGQLVEGFSARAHPEKLASVTLYLPTRRAGRLAREVFLDVLKTDAVILPRIVALGSVDEDELEFAQAESPELSSLDIPPALDGLKRRLTLAKLVAAWAARLPTQDSAAPLVAGGPASFLSLADDLARLIDDMVTRGVDWRAYDKLVPDEHDKYWGLTLDFLKIAKEFWPAILSELDRIEPAARRDKLIEAEAARLLAHQTGPVIAAGSTGSMPATAKFLSAIAKLPQGAVVLPGLDMCLEDDAWNSIGGVRSADGKYAAMPTWSHPQFALHHLVTQIFGITRKDIKSLGKLSHPRDVLASEVMRPSESSAEWNDRLATPDVQSSITAAMTNLAVIEATNPEMEALAIAVAMREAHAHDIPTALVTPDRALARRVIAALGRWNLDVDDSGGDSLMDTQAGLFARLVAETVANDFAPATLLALLKHPLFYLDGAEHAHDAAISDLELALLRGTRPPAGSEGLAQEFARFRDELAKLKRNEVSSIYQGEQRAKLEDQQLNAVQILIDRLRIVFKPLETMKGKAPHDFAKMAQCHRDAIAALSRDDEGKLRAFEGADGLALAASFDELLDADDDGKITPSGLLLQLPDYPDVFQTAFAGKIVRRPQSPSAQLRIYGLLEARLTETKRVILGGLVEGVWPPQPRIDPWLSRPMRHDLGLDLPERRIGLTAHDFVQLLGTDDVILTRASKVGGAPAVASRFLHRLEAVAGKDLWKKAKDKGARYTRFAEELDHPDKIEPVQQPAPKPPLAMRPLKLSATEVEDLFRDPYTIYAKHILKLLPLDPVDMPLTAADRGSAIHEALGDFTKHHAASLPPDASAVLRQYGDKHFAALMDRPEAQALWWPRFLRIADWFVAWEKARREGVTNIDTEIRGLLKISLSPNREFTLSARADRIEHRTDGTFAIVDYKTGQAPTGRQVRLGLSPQLSLEAAILRDGGFESIPKDSSISEFLYVRLSGNNPPGEAKPLELKVNRSDEPQHPNDAADEARRELEARLKNFENELQGYPSLSLPMWSNRYGKYDDLARIKEWSIFGSGGSGE